MPTRNKPLTSGLRCFEAESIYIFREVAAALDGAVFSYSIGKELSALESLAGRSASARCLVDETWWQWISGYRDWLKLHYGAELKGSLA